MTEQEYLKYCLAEVEEKLNWKESIVWKESDYIHLAKIISESSNISISPHTLKRLFGKIKYKKRYNPQLATKDALSRYLGYLNWFEFVEKNKNKFAEAPIIETKHNYKIKKRNYLIVLIIVLIGIILISTNYFKKSDAKIAPFTINLQDTIGIVPFTVPVKYDFKKIKSDSIFIDFDFIHPVHGAQIVNPNKKGNTINFTYQLPGFYNVELKRDQKLLYTKNVLAMSSGWDSYFMSESKLGRYWLDNEIELQNNSDGYLYYSLDYLENVGFNVNQVFYITHRLYKQFKIDGDNFKLEARFKNSEELGGITCYDFILRIICENNLNYLKLMENGCSQFSGVKFGETRLEGNQDNLSAFKLNLKDWNTLLLMVSNKNVEVFINNNLIYKGSYQKANGSIVGLENVFKGTGMLDYLKIQDLNSKKVFFEDFD